jgi:predicted ATPase
VQVASELRDVFIQGVWFVDLAPIHDSALVAPAIAQVLKIQESAGLPLLESLKTAQQHKQLFVMLDSFEQVMEVSPLVAELVAAAAQLKLLVTNRTSLHLLGEQVFVVPPLALPLNPQPPLLHWGENRRN